MTVAVEIPKLGNTVEECLISEWLKANPAPGAQPAIRAVYCLFSHSGLLRGIENVPLME
jgi:hypothetical protein